MENKARLDRNAECFKCGCSTMSDFFKDCPCQVCHNKAPRILDHGPCNPVIVEGKWEKKKK